MIDSGVSGNDVRCCSLEEDPRYVGAIKAHKGDTITVRLTTGTLVNAPKVPVNLGVKFFDFDSIERHLVLFLDLDMISSLVWLGLSAMSHGSTGGRKH